MKAILIVLLILFLLGCAIVLYSILQIIPDEYDKEINDLDYDGTPDDEEDIIDG